MEQKLNKSGYILHLDRILEEKGISRYKLFTETNISQKTIYEIENRDLRLSTIIQLCSYLNCTICQLITIK
jgi:DNA-binding Xre family transcriptional regulator